ncbi:MAG: hypothetical protein AUJ53_10785 [Flavobacteriaceae bacterium CG1_02_35_72]|nr:MAG: hypothetical protein AUJ53_10785 [Flavobacteriaceae bacterium CG1_02_35_72]
MIDIIVSAAIWLYIAFLLAKELQGIILIHLIAGIVSSCYGCALFHLFFFAGGFKIFNAVYQLMLIPFVNLKNILNFINI